MRGCLRACAATFDLTVGNLVALILFWDHSIHFATPNIAEGEVIVIEGGLQDFFGGDVTFGRFGWVEEGRLHGSKGASEWTPAPKYSEHIEGHHDMSAILGPFYLPILGLWSIIATGLDLGAEHTYPETSADECAGRQYDLLHPRPKKSTPKNRSGACVAAMFMVFGGCHFNPRTFLVDRANPPSFHFAGPITQEDARFVRIEFRAPGMRPKLLWKICATPPVQTSELDVRYGVVPDGFVQTFPPAGCAPTPLTTLDRSSLVVVATTFVDVRCFTSSDGKLGYDENSDHYYEDYADPDFPM